MFEFWGEIVCALWLCMKALIITVNNLLLGICKEFHIKNVFLVFEKLNIL